MKLGTWFLSLSLHIPCSERYVADNVFADVSLGVMIIRGENLALFGEARGNGQLEEVPISSVLQRIQDLDRESKGRLGLSVDLGFLDEI